MTRRPLAIALFAALISALVIVPSGAASAAVPVPARLSTTSAAGVAILSSRTAFPAAGSAGTVVVTNGANVMLGSIAGSAAASLDGSLLLTAPTVMSAATRAELDRLAPEHVLIVGSTKDVSAAVEAKLRAAYPGTERISGTDVYATSVLLASRSVTTAQNVFVVPGDAAPSVISAAALAGTSRSPLVLVRPADVAARADLVTLVQAKGVTSATLVGGVPASAAGMQQSLQSKGLQVDRVTASGYPAMALALATRFTAPERAFIVPTSSSALGLGAIVLAARAGSPVIFSSAMCVNPSLTATLTSTAISAVTLVGTTKQIRGLVGSLTLCLSTTTPSSPWVFVNKKNRLNPASYVPKSLRVPSIRRTGSHLLQSTAATQLEKLAAGVKAAGKGEIGIVSGYRSYATQKALYARYVRTNGQAWADSQSARAGHSEHQLGLAADVSACSASGCSSIYTFDKTAQGKWVAANAHKYGFVIRYAYGQTKTTGYAFEPWHLRYVGIPLATDYKAGGFTTLEAYYGKPAAPKY